MQEWHFVAQGGGGFDPRLYRPTLYSQFFNVESIPLLVMSLKTRTSKSSSERQSVRVLASKSEPSLAEEV